MASRTETAIQLIAPQTRAAVGVDTYVQSYPDPNAGQDLAGIAQALGIVAGKVQKSAAEKKAEKEAEYSSNLDYYAQSFMADNTNGLVDAAQVGRAYPGASPIVAGKITGLIGQNWGNTYARGRIDEFLQAGDSVRMDPVAQRQFFDGLRNEVSEKTAGNPFYGQGALSATNSIINEYESNLQREGATQQQALQEDDFISNFGAAITGQPVQAPDFSGSGAALPHELVGAKTPMAVARAYLGASEGPQARVLSSFFKASAGQDINPKDTPWCAAFTNAVLGASGEEGTGKLNARSFLGWGTDVTNAPKEGDVVVLKRGTSDWEGHVGFYMGTNADGSIRILSGNQGNSVTEANFPAADLLGIRRGKAGAAANAGTEFAFPGASGSTGIDPSTAPTALLEIIGQGESSSNYNAYSGNAQNQSVRFTDMTLTEVIEWQRGTIANGSTPSSAVGKYQFLRPTLQQAMKDLGLPPDTKLTPQVQDQIAMHLLEKRGYQDFKDGKITASEFQDNLAKEWAAIPTSAGGGYYSGQNPNIDGGKLRVALSTTGPVGNPAEAVDQYGINTSSINPIRQRELGVTTAIELATAQRDSTILDRLPAAWLGIPEIAAKVAATKESISNLTFDSWNHQRTVDTFMKQEALETGQKGILAKLSETGQIDIADYINDPDLYSFAKSVQGDERIRPEVSAATVSRLEQQLLGWGTTGIPDTISGVNDFDKMRNVIIGYTGITAADRTKMLEQLPVYLEGVNLINDDKTDAFYRNSVGDGLSTYLMTLDGSMAKMLGTNPSGQVREVFDSTLQDLISDSIEGGFGIPRGAEKRAMLKEAKDAAMETFTMLKETATGIAPIATTAPTPTAPSAATTPDLDAIRAKEARGEAITDEEFILIH